MDKQNPSSKSATMNGASQFDPNFTQHVINSMGPKTSPRLRQIMSSLIRHIHDFARENELTVDEWMKGVEVINRAGQMSNDRRNEGQLLCDVIGLSSLVEEINYQKAVEAADTATPSALLGPFFRHNAPKREKNDSIILDTPEDAQVLYMHGRVLSSKDQKPLPNACIDVWQASTNGMYEQQDPNQQDFNLRGKFQTDEHGEYAFYCLRPTAYPIPDDGPAGKLLKMMDRHCYRPAHIHFIVMLDGFKPITTQIFDSEGEYLDDDSVFAVKDSLVVKFLKLEGNPKAELELKYDILMAPTDEIGGP